MRRFIRIPFQGRPFPLGSTVTLEPETNSWCAAVGNNRWSFDPENDTGGVFHDDHATPKITSFVVDHYTMYDEDVVYYLGGD